MVDIYVGPDSSHWPLHERLLCYHSPFFARIFYDKNKNWRPSQNKSYGLPDEDDQRPFTMLVGWLYSRAIKPPTSEKDIGPLLDLYLLADKFEMEKLEEDIVDAVREWYHTSSTYPGLRRVQYIYANTDEDNQMREMMVSSVARQLVTADTFPTHWQQALRRDGQLGVDIIRAFQQWHIEERSIPDVRDGSMDRGRLAKGGFSAVEEDRGTSIETVVTDGTADTNHGVQSLGSETSGAEDKSKGRAMSNKVDTEA